MMDPFGNYLIQKLLDRCSEEQRLQVGACAAGGRPGQACSVGGLWVPRHRLRGGSKGSASLLPVMAHRPANPSS